MTITSTESWELQWLHSCRLHMHHPPAALPPRTNVASYDSASAFSLSALRALLSKRLCRLAPRIACCLLSTPINQYPKLPPAPAKTGYAHSDSLLKNGRISRPSCQKRTAMPAEPISVERLYFIPQSEERRGSEVTEPEDVPKPLQNRTLWTILTFTTRMV